MAEYYRKKQPSCTTPDGREWFASGGGNTNPEYIEREAAERILESVGAPAYAIHALALVKTADVVPVVHGRWIKSVVIQTDTSTLYDYTCPVCSIVSGCECNYCPNCGARMDGGNDG